MDQLRLDIKLLLIKTLELEDITPEDIADDAPLFEHSGLGLDSIDALEIGVALRKTYNLVLEANSNGNREHFRSINSLAAFIEKQTS